MVAILRDDILVSAFHEVLMSGEVGGEEPLVAQIVFRLCLSIQGVDGATGASHVCHDTIAQVALVVVCHPCVDVTRLGCQLQVPAPTVPGEDTTEGVLALTILKVGFLAMIHGEHGQLAVGIDIPGIQTQAVALQGIVVHLLKDIEVAKGTTTVTIDGIVLGDYVHILIVDIHLLVPIAEFVVVGGRGQYSTCGHLPMLVAVGETEKFVKGLERPNALNVLQTETICLGRLGGEFHRTSKSTASFVYRGGTMQERSIVYEVSRNHGKVRHAQHGAVYLHSIPRYLSVRGRGTTKCHGGEGGTSVVLDKDGRVEREHIRHGEGNVLLQCQGVEPGDLRTYLLHGTQVVHLHLGQSTHPKGGVCTIPRHCLGTGRENCHEKRKKKFLVIRHSHSPFYFQQKAPGIMPT